MRLPSRFILPTTIVVTALAMAGCGSAGSEVSTTNAPLAAAVNPASHWTYEGAEGPGKWGGLNSDYETCDTGRAQSPIDLPAALPESTGEIEVVTEPVEGEVVDTGHTIQLKNAEDASTVAYEGDDYALLQMHFHTPSEHSVNGQLAAVEFHFVHADEKGHLLVLGVLGVEGAESAAWAPFVEAVAAHPAAADSSVDADFPELDVNVAELLPDSLEYYAYEGSLTTPPCTEDVQWIVLSTPVEFSAAQLAVLSEAHEHNARPVQSLGDRVVTGGTGTLDE